LLKINLDFTLSKRYNISGLGRIVLVIKTFLFFDQNDTTFSGVDVRRLLRLPKDVSIAQPKRPGTNLIKLFMAVVYELI